jgi:tetratricopeptide (TPR) repeat protein
LTGLAVVLSHLGSGEEALTTAEEAVRLVRAEAADILVAAGDAWTGEYAERDVDLAYSDCRMTLTESIMQWADQLEDLNRRDEAVSVVADAIEELRPPPGDLSGYLFATVLFAQARRLERAGRDADAVLARAEGIDVLRELTDVDEPGSRLVDELVAQAGVLTRLGRNDEAEQARNEAIRRNVASEAEGALDE